MCFVPIVTLAQLNTIPEGLFPTHLEHPNSSSDYTNNLSSSKLKLSNTIYYGQRFCPSANHPSTYVRVNFIFLQREDGTGNFREDNSEEQAYLNDYIQELNKTYAELYDPQDPICYTGNDFIPNTKIQFLVNKVYIRDGFYWNNRSDRGYKCPTFRDYWYLNRLDSLIVNNPIIPRGINIYFTEDSLVFNKYWSEQDAPDTLDFIGASYACSEPPSTQDYIRSSRIHIPDKYSKYLWMKNSVPKMGKYNYPSWDTIVRFWCFMAGARGAAHELGHSLNWDHEDLYGQMLCDNSIMNPAGSSARNYLPPYKIGWAHAMLGFSNLRSFVPTETFIGTKTISTVETWKNIRFYQSLNIMPNGNLTLPYGAIMPQQASINIFGRLCLENSNLTSINESCGGIRVKSGGKLVLNNTEIKDYNIVVEPGGSLHILGTLSVVGNHHITIEKGGYICVDPNANINLANQNSRLIYKECAKSSFPTNPSCNCISLPSNFPKTGNGFVSDFNSNYYFQNEIIRNVKTITCARIISFGYNVTSEKNVGNVSIVRGGNVSCEGKVILLDKGFECLEGGTFETIHTEY